MATELTIVGKARVHLVVQDGLEVAGVDADGREVTVTVAAAQRPSEPQAAAPMSWTQVRLITGVLVALFAVLIALILFAVPG